MRSRSNGNTPWQKIWKFITNPTVEVLLAVAVMVVSAWFVIESESAPRKNANGFPVFFGHK